MIVIVCPLLLVNELVVASVNAAPPFLPVQVGFAASVHTAPLAVKTTVFESVVIAVVVVAFSTIFDGVRLIDVSSTSPSIAVIAVTELYDAAALGVASVLETPVAVKAVTVAPGFSASSLDAAHARTMAAWLVPVAAPEKVIVIVSAAMLPTVVVTILVRDGELPDCAIAHPERVAGVAAHIEATVLVIVIVVGPAVVLASCVHVKIIFAGVVPSEPTAETCVAAIASVPCVCPDAAPTKMRPTSRLNKCAILLRN